MKAFVFFDEDTLSRDVASTASDRSHATGSISSWRPSLKAAPTVPLERGSIFSKSLEAGERLTVTVTTGHAWITMEGDRRDHVLTANEQRPFAGPGLLVIEGLEQGARVRLQPECACAIS